MYINQAVSSDGVPRQTAFPGRWPYCRRKASTETQALLGTSFSTADRQPRARSRDVQSRNPADYGTHSLRRAKVSILHKRTGNLRACRLPLGHTKLESTVRYLGIEVADALSLSEETEICGSAPTLRRSRLPLAHDMLATRFRPSFPGHPLDVARRSAARGAGVRSRAGGRRAPHARGRALRRSRSA